ncbi:endonuclease IV [Candidatus Pacearchaeota archaeon]|jgi:deoxyribonuclease-4|nr:endonuclease IV [Candidatus Pacearchaeota archaeon]|tara:strand:+ start:2920 stop:3702 length:783 start_codon:yes stop_codon:yes gene_type:complete
MSIKFGPAGLGPTKEAISNLEKYHNLGLKACEIAFTYGVYIKNKEDAIKIGKAAKKFNIQLSIHAPYWINLNSTDKDKIEKSKQRILRCCEVGTYLGAKRIVFHPGYYGKMDKDETYENIKREIIDIQKIIKQKKYTPLLAPETTGKVNVFGSIDEIKKLAKDTKTSFCIDFAHILARYKNYNFKEVLKKFKNYKKIHIHFSGIEYGEKGEKHHKLTPNIDIEKLISNLPKDIDITVINESPDTIGDSIKSIEIYRRQEQ